MTVLSWFDWLSLAIAVVSMLLTYRVERRQARQLETIKRKEDEIKCRLTKKGRKR